MISRIENIRFEYWYYYLFYILIVFVFSIGFRALFSLMRARAAEYENEKQNKYWVFYEVSRFDRFKIIFKGNSKVEPYPDLWYNFQLGTIELFIFPILMRVDAIAIIGAWIGFKTVAQWSAWNKNRLTFNRYLIANALQVIISFLLMNWFMPIV